MKLKIESIRVADLSPDPKNPHTHTEEQVEKIADSIREFGFLCPVVVSGGFITAGEGRWRAAKKMGLDEVPCVRADHLTEAQRHAFMIADNKLTEIAGWDENLLAEMFKDLEIEGVDLLLTGFDLPEIEEIIFEPDFEPVNQDSQGRLDRLNPVTCPQCGHEFSPSH